MADSTAGSTRGDDDRKRWSDYFAATAGKPVHPIFERLEPHLPAEGHAIDLGCGAGRGTTWLLARGLRVTATDASPEAIEFVRSRLPVAANAETICAPFQTLDLGTYDVAVACYTLFFLPRPDFDAFWPRAVAAVRPGGVFAGEFLGPRDDWASDLTAHDRDEARALLSPFDLLHFEEEESDGETALGEKKHWHVFHWIGRKR